MKTAAGKKTYPLDNAQPSDGDIAEALLAPVPADQGDREEDRSWIPSHGAIARLTEAIRALLFPAGPRGPKELAEEARKAVSRRLSEIREDLARQIALTISHRCEATPGPCPSCREQAREKAVAFLRLLPDLREALVQDLDAALYGDPAAKSRQEIVACYPGFLAITVYRAAHALHLMGIRLIPRMMTEYAHSLTGIDIHPGARIGESFFIDHGTGVVIGETTRIGDRVRIYQGVTLGALSLPSHQIDRFRDRRRHPTIENDVVIYANATLLGKNAVVGDRSVIGASVWITEPVPPDTKVLLKQPESIRIARRVSRGSREEVRP